MVAFNPTLAVYIPLINSFWADSKKITQVFAEQNIGYVSRVKIIKKLTKSRTSTSNKVTLSAAVYFHEWFDNDIAHNLQARIHDPLREARVVIDEPWYFLLLKSNKQDPPRPRHRRRNDYFQDENENENDNDNDNDNEDEDEANPAPVWNLFLQQQQQQEGTVARDHSARDHSALDHSALDHSARDHSALDAALEAMDRETYALNLASIGLDMTAENPAWNKFIPPPSSSYSLEDLSAATANFALSYHRTAAAEFIPVPYYF